MWRLRLAPKPFMVAELSSLEHVSNQHGSTDRRGSSCSGKRHRNHLFNVQTLVETELPIQCDSSVDLFKNKILLLKLPHFEVVISN